jgi:hypothetical protein
MSDPIERLREDARRAGGVGHERPDLSGSLARIHERASGFEPGGLTRQKRARVGAWGVAGVGAVAAAGLAVSGVLTPDGGSSPEAAPSTAESFSATPQGGATGQAVAYVHRARAAVSGLDLESLILSIRTTDRSQDDGGTNASATVKRDVLAGDGSASRSWVPAAPGKGGPQDQEVRRAAGADRTTTWWVSPSKGVYARFVVEGLDSDENPSAQATRPGNRVAAIGARLGEIEHAMKVQGVTVSGPTATKVDGRDATCVTLTGDGSTAWVWIPKAKQKGMGKDASVLSWSSRTCFDHASNLPLVDTFTQHRDSAVTDAVSRSGTSASYAWLPRDAASEKLLAPDLDGLRQVSRDQYVQLTQ